MTRRTFIKSGAGLAAIIAAGKAPAALMRSMLAARQSICAGGKSLPYLKRLQYITASGSQWINTGISLNAGGAAVNSLHVRTKFTVGSGSSDHMVLGSRQSTSAGMTVKFPNVFSGQMEILFGGLGTRYQITAGNTYTCDFVCEDSRSIFSVNGVEYQNVPYVNNRLGGSIPMYLFALNQNGTANWKANHSIYEASVEKNGVMLMNYMPVLDLNGDPKMFDLVTQSYPTHYGAFIAGPDAISAGGGGYKLICARRSPTRSWRPSRRFCTRQSWKEAA